MNSNIFQSASKIVFILMAVAVSVLTFLGKVDPKDFMMLASMAFSFYFANKGDSDQPFLGK
jgi:asparagine N-glycosylation enzyme membrane subunit Stt3